MQVFYVLVIRVTNLLSCNLWLRAYWIDFNQFVPWLLYTTQTMLSFKPPSNFKYQKIFFSFILLKILCSPDDGLCSSSPLIKLFSMSLGENMFSVVRKGKHPFHFQNELLELWLLELLEMIRFLLILLKTIIPNLKKKKSGSLVNCSRVFGILNFLGHK